MTHKNDTGNIKRRSLSARESGSNGLVSRHTIRQLAGLLLMFAALPAWSAGLQIPSVHSLTPARKPAHLQLPPAKPVIVGANYHLSASCVNPLHAISVTVRIREQGGPLKAGQARVQISEPGVHMSPVMNAANAASLIPAMAPGQNYTTRQWVGTLPEFRKALPGSHTLLVEVVPQVSDRPDAPKPISRSMFRLPVKIPAGYCQSSLRPAAKGTALLKPGVPHYPPSPCKTRDCTVRKQQLSGVVARPKANLKLKPCNTPACLAARQAKGKKFGSALKPDLHVVSVKVTPERSVSGTPITVTVVLQNKGALPSNAGVGLSIFCNAYQGANTPPVAWTCKIPGTLTSPGGMPMWNIALPSVPGHHQKTFSVTIPEEHWPDGLYYFTHLEPGKVATIPDLVKAKTDSIIQIDAK